MQLRQPLVHVPCNQLDELHIPVGHAGGLCSIHSTGRRCITCRHTQAARQADRQAGRAS